MSLGWGWEELDNTELLFFSLVVSTLVFSLLALRKFYIHVSDYISLQLKLHVDRFIVSS